MAGEPLGDRNHRFTASRSSERNVAISTVSSNEDRAKSWSASDGVFLGNQSGTRTRAQFVRKMT